MTHTFFVSGISTDVGKTVASAVISEALHAAYWKPVQAGDLNHTDTHKVEEWTTHVQVLPEAYRLNKPMSPHAAALEDGVRIDIPDIPQTNGHLVIEGAGGLLVPLTDDGLLIADMVQHWKIPVILVSKHYLGSINHTLLSVEVLKARKIPLAGILFMGDELRATESIIASCTGVPILGRIPWMKEVNKTTIGEQAARLQPVLMDALNGKTNKEDHV